MTRPFDRRAFLRGSLLATAGGASLAACTSEPPAPAATPSGSSPSPGPADSWAPRPQKVDGLQVVAARAQRQLLLHTEAGDVDFLAGVNLGGTTPGHPAGTLSATRADYRRWFPMIAGLGLHVVRVATIHPPAMYEELLAYNRAHPRSAIYLVQGVELPRIGLTASDTLFSAHVLAAMKAEIAAASAAVHGRLERKTAPAPAAPTGRWTADVSPWTAGWIVGGRVDPGLLNRTDGAAGSAAAHRGRYFSSTPEATPTERWLAARLDELATAEAKLGTAAPIAFGNRAETDPLPHPDDPDRADDLVSLDPTHVESGAAWPAGTFAAYEAQPYAPLYLFLQKDYSGPEPYQSYLQALQGAHPELPMVVTSFGVSTALGSAASGPNGRNAGHHDEAEAMQQHADLLRTMDDSGLAGGLLAAWHDDWSATTWNTLPRVLPVPVARRLLAHDPLTSDQWNGLVSFDSVRVGERTVLDRPDNFLEKVVFDHDASWWYLTMYFKGRVTSPVEIGFDFIPGQGLRFPGGSGAPIFDCALRMVPTMSTAVAYVRSDLDPVRLDGLPPGWWPTPDKTGWNTQELTLNRAYVVPTTGRAVGPTFLDVGNLLLGSWWDENADDYNTLATWHLARAADDTPMILRFRLPWAFLGMADPSARRALVPSGFRGTTRPVQTVGVTIESSTPGSPVTFPLTWPEWSTTPYRERLKSGSDVLAQAARDVSARVGARS